MFDPDGAKSEEWSQINMCARADEETGFVENWSNTLGLTVDRYLPFSSMQDVESDYSDFFGSNRVQERTRLLQSYLKDGTIPPEVYNQYSVRQPRTGRRTNWNGIAEWANANLKDDIAPIITDSEYEADRNETISQRSKYVEEVQSRADWGGIAGQFIGGMHAMALDPVTAVTLPLSAPLVGISRTSRALYTATMAYRTALFNAGLQIPMEGMIWEWNEEIGADYTWQEAGINVLATGVLSGAIGGVAANIGHRFTGSYRGRAGDFLSKDRDSLVESFKKIGLDDTDAEAMGSYQYEINNAVDDPVVAVAKDIEETVPSKERTPEERNLVKEADAILEADKPKKVKKKKTGPKKAAIKFDTDKTYYHANRGGITGGAFDNSRLPKIDPDAPFNAHWFSIEDDLPDPSVAGVAGKGHDTVTAVHLNLSKPANMKIVGATQKAWAKKHGDVQPTATELREELTRKGYTHMAWDGRKPVDAAVLEEKGKVKMEMNDGTTLWIKKNDMGTYDITHPKDGVIMTDFDDLDAILREFPEANDIAMFDAKDILIIEKSSPDVDVPPMKTKDFSEDLEKHQEDLNSRGKEVDDVEPVVKADDEAEIVEKLYDEVPDDLEYYVDGEPTRAKDLIDDYENDLTELDEVMECLING